MDFNQAGNAFVRFCPITEITAVGLSPHLITGLLIRHIREYFQPGQIESPYLQNLIWVPRKENPVFMDETLTTVLVEPEGVDKPLNAPLCARIIVDRSEYDFPTFAVGDNAYHGDWAAKAPVLAGMARSDLITGGHVVSCQGPEKGFTEVLGWEVARHLHQFRTQWMQSYGFAVFGVQKLGKVRPVDKGMGHAVDIQVGYSFTDNYVVAEVAARFQGVAFNLSQE